MWVAPAFPQRGIGRTLRHAVMAQARGHGLTRLGLWAPRPAPILPHKGSPRAVTP
jgi:Acetyltransferase (GNAT) family